MAHEEKSTKHHHHDQDHSIEEGQDHVHNHDLPARELSRRDLLRIGGVLLGGSLLPRSFQRFDINEGARKRIYIALDDHTDYFWTADDDTYRQAFLDMLDYYLDLADATEESPSDFQSRFNTDGSFWLWTYEKNRTPQQFNRLIERIRDGHISMPLNALVVCLGGAPTEAILRGMYYAGKLERRHNLRFRLAIAMENQTLPYGLGALWFGSGARYSWKGICSCATRVTNPGDREHEIYWWRGADGSRILMKWNSQFVSSIHMGGYAEARDPWAIVDFVDEDANFKVRFPYKVIGAFGKGWDDLTTLNDEFPTVAQVKSNENRRVIVSNEVDFFVDFEKTHGDQIPTKSCSFGNEWDLYCASMPELSAQVKRLVEKLRTAEALASLVIQKQPDFMVGREAARDLAWMSLGLYWEHNWTADGPISRDIRAQWQRELVGNMAAYINNLYDDVLNVIRAQVKLPAAAAERYLVFNPLSWARTDFVDVLFSEPDGPFHVYDLLGKQETPVQLVTIDGQSYLRILAGTVPPVGYKVFEIRSGAGKDYADAAEIDGSTLDHKYYSLEVAPNGAIVSLIDHQRGNRQIVREVDNRFINDLGGVDGAVGTVTAENVGPVSVTLRIDSSTPFQHTTRITVARGSRTLRIDNTITETFLGTPTWGFGLNMDNPDVWHEEVGSLIRAKLLADDGHYSPRNARYDWLTLNHFVQMNGADQVGVTLSNADCYFMRVGLSTTENLDSETPLISVLAGGQVDGPNLGIPAQGGDSLFLQRFALRTTGAYSPSMAMRFALEHQNPLVAVEVNGEAPAYPAQRYSFMTITNPSVILWALKPADDGNGIIMRLWNVTDQPQNTTISFNGRTMKKVVKVTHIETPAGTPRRDLSTLKLKLSPNKMVSYLVNLEGSSQTMDDFIPLPPPPSSNG